MTEALRSIPRPRRLGERLGERLVLRALERIEEGALELRLPSGEVRRFGSGAPVAATVESADLFRRLARSPRLGLGESYAAGDWRADDLVALFELLVRNLDAWRARSRLARLQRRVPHLPRHQGLGRARRNVAYHYDLGNDLYRLFLDDSLTYSCGIWDGGQDTLQEAQRRKLRRVCDKLRLGPDDHVLEIGCGWGSFALTAAREYGARVTGLTISERQAELARERVADAGLADRVEIRLQDYRTLEGAFTKIASIEMLEAVGYTQFGTFFAACDRLLAPCGWACVQTIAIPDQRFEQHRRTTTWIERYVFPGSLLPSVEALATAMARSSELGIYDLEEIGPHYAPTLRAWRERFLANLSEVHRLGYDDRFARIWEFYLAYCEAAFRRRALRDVQLVLSRPFNDKLQ